MTAFRFGIWPSNPTLPPPIFGEWPPFPSEPPQFGVWPPIPVILVTNLFDAGPGSLRQAVADVNAHPGAEIDFVSGLSGTITLTTGQLRLSAAAIINGPGKSVISVNGNAADRLLYLLYDGSPPKNTLISGLTFTNGNVGAGGEGGGIKNSGGALQLTDCDITACVADGSGGGLRAIYPTTLTRCDVTGNTSNHDGGGLSFKDNLHGPAGVQFRVLDCDVSGNTSAHRGGGIDVRLYGHALEIDQTTVSGNIAASQAGGVAFFLYYGPGAAATIRNSTVSGNVANGDLGGSNDISGGGGIGAYLKVPCGDLDVIQCTVSGNSAPRVAPSSGGNAGGISLSGGAGGAVNIGLSTIADNSCGNVGGGIWSRPSDPQPRVLRNTIVAGNTNGGAASPDISGAVNADYCLVQDATGATLTGAHNLTGVDPLLGALANNGGPTQTQLPGMGSPAIDAGDPAFTPPPATDQRGVGFPRVKGGRLDIGAVEK